MQTNQTPEALAQAIKDAVGEYANLIRMGHVADAIPVLSKLIADTDRLRDMAASGAAVVNAAREAMNDSFEAGNDAMDISIPSHLAAALSLRLDEHDDATKRGGA
jgi:hypothetical protein